MKHDDMQPIDQVTRPTITTKEAAFYLNRKEQTLRSWAMKSRISMIKPISFNGRLAWKVDDIKRLLGIS